MSNIIKDFMAEQQKNEADRRIVVRKSDDNVYVFFKDRFNSDTGEKEEQVVVDAITKAKIKEKIAKHKEEIAELQLFMDTVMVEEVI